MSFILWPLKALVEEFKISWAFNHRDLTATVVPFSLFTIASSLESESSPESILSNVAKSATLAYMLLYTFTTSNQMNGIEEDRLNKPDRPIVSGRVSLQAAYTRYVLLSIASLIYSRFMGVEEGAVMFMAFGAMHNLAGLASLGPTKDLLTTAVLTSGLYSAWELGGGTTRRGLEWIMCLAFNLLFSISIQDLRDVIGDAATGRHTTPLMLGKPYDRIYIAVCMLSTRALTLKIQYLKSNHPYASKASAFLIVMTDLFLVFRVLTRQTIAEDKKTYRLYMLRFCVELLFSSCVLSA